MVMFVDESQDSRYFALGAAVRLNANPGHVVVTQTRKALGPQGRLLPEFHESALNQVNPVAIDAFLDNMVYESLRKRRHRILRKNISVYLVYYRNTPAERASRSWPLPDYSPFTSPYLRRYGRRSIQRQERRFAVIVSKGSLVSCLTYRG